MKPTKEQLTDTSKALFEAYWNDAGNWSGNPMVGGNVGGSKEDRGNLTQLKRAGLITTFTDEGFTFISFTDQGKILGADIDAKEIEAMKRKAGYSC